MLYAECLPNHVRNGRGRENDAPAANGAADVVAERGVYCRLDGLGIVRDPVALGPIVGAGVHPATRGSPLHVDEYSPTWTNSQGCSLCEKVASSDVIRRRHLFAAVWSAMYDGRSPTLTLDSFLIEASCRRSFWERVYSGLIQAETQTYTL